MLAQTVERVGEEIAADHIFVITNREHRETVKEVCPDIPEENLIGEPVGRDTAPAVALAALLVKRRDPEAVFAVLPADHVIHDRSGFQDVLDAAFEAASVQPVLVTIGVGPTYPATGYGYIQVGQEAMESRNLPVYRTLGFKEKPDRETAESYLESGEYFWNAGMFVWSVPTLAAALEEHVPRLSEAFRAMEKDLDSGEAIESVLESRFPKLDKISIDYALMEKAANVVLIEAAFDWDDVGEWTAIARHTPSDGSENSVKGDVVLRDCKKTITVSHEGHTTVMLGVEDMIVVTTPDATLVCHKSQTQNLKKLVGELNEDRPHLV